VINDLGVSVLSSRLVQQEIKNKKVIVVPIENIVFEQNYNIIYHKNKYLARSVRTFIEICKSSSEN